MSAPRGPSPKGPIHPADRCGRCHSATRPCAPGMKTCQHCLDARQVARGEEPSAPALHRRLPLDSGWSSLFRAGEGGERRECANYDRCLDAFQGNGPAYCPEGCARWEMPERVRATDFMGTGGERNLPAGD